MIDDGTFVEKMQAYAEIVADYLKEHPMIIVDTAIVVVIAMLYFLLFGWKKALKVETGTLPAGGAKKKDMRAAVSLALGVPLLKGADDGIDAIAVALCRVKRDAVDQAQLFRVRA